MPSTPYATGKVAVFGADSTITLTGSGIISSNEIAVQGMEYRGTAEGVELTNGAGTVIAKHYYKPQAKCTVRFKPFGAISDSVATLQAKVFLPAPGSTVAISSATIDAFEGNWNFTGNGSIAPSQTGHAEMTLELERAGESSGAAAYLTPA